MRYGYWLPVFGGWLRNVEDEGMEATWEYVRRLALRSEHIGFDLALIAERTVNGIKRPEAPALDAWSTAAALAAITRRLELMVAARPALHQPALFAKQAANVDRISGGRLSLQLVADWPEVEAPQYGLPLVPRQERYRQAAEWLEVVDGLWHRDRYTFSGRYYHTRGAILEPKPVVRPRPPIYAEGQSDEARQFVAGRCDAYLMHGDPPERIAVRVDDLTRRREAAGEPPLIFAMTAYTILRDTEREARDELQRITNVKQTSSSYRNYRQWVANAKPDPSESLEDYAVTHGGLRAGLVGTGAQLAERIARFERAGVSLLVLQCSPQIEEMDRFASAIIASDRPAEPDTSWATKG